MEHWVAANRRVEGPPEVMRAQLRIDPAGLLARSTADGTAGIGAPDGSVLVHLPGHVVGREVQKQVRVQTGAPRDTVGRTVVPVEWSAEPGRHAFPTFTGTVEIEEHSVRAAEVTVAGCAVPPVGPIGAAIDTLGLGTVAERTVQFLADRLAVTLHEVATRRSGATPGGRRNAPRNHPPLTVG